MCLELNANDILIKFCLHQSMKKLKKTSLKIKTKRLIIRPMQMRDDRAWMAAHCAMLPTRLAWEIPRLPVTKLNYKEYEKILKFHKEELASQKALTLGIFHHDIETLLGFLNLKNISSEESSAELDFTIFNIYIGKGFAKEVINAGLKLVKNLGISKVEIVTKPESRLKH